MTLEASNTTYYFVSYTFSGWYHNGIIHVHPFEWLKDKMKMTKIISFQKLSAEDVMVAKTHSKELFQ